MKPPLPTKKESLKEKKNPFSFTKFLAKKKDDAQEYVTSYDEYG